MARKDTFTIVDVGRWLAGIDPAFRFWMHGKPKLFLKEKRPVRHKHIKERRCMFCGSYDYVYPITVNICGKCYKDKIYRDGVVTAKKRINMEGQECHRCGRRVAIYYTLNGQICNKCTWKITPRIERGRERRLKLT